jgi:hypothetical protein
MAQIIEILEALFVQFAEWFEVLIIWIQELIGTL